MTAVHIHKNQYRGINAHLHSLLQVKGNWDSLHTLHIGDIARALQAQLIPMGYEADLEQGLQIKRAGEPTRYPKSDVSVYDKLPARLAQPAPTAASVSAPELVLPLVTLMDMTDDKIEDYQSIRIYAQSPKPDARGVPVAWIELLSPSNKPTERDFDEYRAKREAVLRAGIVFLEIDYLHHTPPTFAGIPDYTCRDAQNNAPPGAQPYRITLIDPRFDFHDIVGSSWLFGVDDPIPTVTIPLNAGDRLAFDFGAPYQRTFEEMYYGSKVDYRQLPLSFERYACADQTKIAARMLATLDMAAHGDPLDTPRFPLEPITLDDALARLAALVV